METEPIYIGIPQTAKTYYHKISNGNVSIMRLTTILNWAEYSLKCNRCDAQHFVKNLSGLQTVVNEEIEQFCGEHQHPDWQSYKFTLTTSAKPDNNGLKTILGINQKETVTLSKEEYNRLIGNLPKAAVEEEGRMFRKEDE